MCEACGGNQTAVSDLTPSEFGRGGPAQRGQSSQHCKISYALYFSPVNSDLVSFFLFSFSFCGVFCLCLISSQIYSLCSFVTASFTERQKRWMQMKSGVDKQHFDIVLWVFFCSSRLTHRQSSRVELWVFSPPFITLCLSLPSISLIKSSLFSRFFSLCPILLFPNN